MRSNTRTAGDAAGPGFETVAEHLAAAVPAAAPDDTAGGIRQALTGRRYDCATAVAVCTGDGRLTGLIRLEDLLAADPSTPASALMRPDPPTVGPDTDQEIAAHTALVDSDGVLCVTDTNGRLLGFVTPERMLTVLRWEHEEDMARLAGVLHDSAEARTAGDEPIQRRFAHRLPWLLFGLAGALTAALIMGSFEGALARDVMLAFFVPGVAYIAAAVGIQTQTLVIRGLAFGVPVRRLVRRETLTGLAVGATLAACFYPAAVLLWGRPDVALATAIAIFTAATMATLVAMAFPALLHRLGYDPAYGSGPVATVVQDMLSITVYLVSAQLIVG